MTRATAVQMVDDLSALAGVTSVTVHLGGTPAAPDWTVVATRPGGVTGAQMNTEASKFSVTATTDIVRFT